MTRKFMGVVLALTALFVVCMLGRDAAAAGNFKLKNTEASEVSGGWHIFVTIELPKAPTIGHVPLRFLFTKTAVYERALVDNRDDPVTNRMSMENQTPSIESLDVDFADGSGKIFKTTRFDFYLTRTRGYVAGEYIVQLRTADGIDIGGKASMTLKGDNPVVDRRSITFNAKESKIKKVDTGIDGGLLAKNSNEDVEHAGVQTGDINATGTAKPFIPDEAYQPTPEEQGLKEHPKGCGCSIPGTSAGGALGFGAASLAGIAAALARRRRRRP